MPLRLAFALSLLLASAASAQVVGTAYDTGSDRPGVRVGLMGGVSVYNGPNVLYNDTGDLQRVDQENVTEVRPAVTGFVDVPLSGDRLYLRGLAGLLNIGADDDGVIARNGGNPFLTNENLLLEADLLLNLASPRASSAAPYVFGGFGALIADPFGTDDVADALDRKRTAYLLPLGVGLNLGLTPNLSLFGEASYRFPLNDVGDNDDLLDDFFEICDGDPDCIAKCELDPTDPKCVLEDADTDFDTSFGSGLLTGGLRLGFGGRRRAFVPPPPEREVIVERQPIVVPPVEPEAPEPLVCDLVELNTVYFEHGSGALSTRARRLLNENIGLLLENSACCVLIDGYTDASEYDRDGMALSGDRAQTVYNYYLSQGVAASRLQVRNRGAAQPPCDKEDPGIGCSRNRRAESVPMDCEDFERMVGY